MAWPPVSWLVLALMGDHGPDGRDREGDRWGDPRLGRSRPSCCWGASLTPDSLGDNHGGYLPCVALLGLDAGWSPGSASTAGGRSRGSVASP